MRKIDSMADFEKAAVKAVNDAGIELEDNDSALHVSIVQFRSDKPSYTLSFTDGDGNDYYGNGHSPEVAIQSAIAMARPANIKL
jgi:hypothetical protein